MLLGGMFTMLWLISRAFIRWLEVRAQLRVWGPGPYGAGHVDGGAQHHARTYARMPR